MSSRPSTTAVARFYRVLSVVLLLIGAPLFALLPLHFAGIDLPVWPAIEESNYLAATGGAAVLGLAWLCRRVALEPDLSRIAAAPLSIVFFGWAMVRYLTFFFGESLVGLSLIHI